MKNITKYFLEQSIGNYVILTCKDYRVYKGKLLNIIENSLVLDNDICVERSKIISMESIVIH
jgi:small nuclear ribonucleoprotein (snRNP)-like protein